MAKVYITEYQSLQDRIGMTYVAQMPMNPPVSYQSVLIGSTSVPSGPFDPRTNIIRVEADAVCSIDIGASPTGTTGTMRLASNTVGEYFGVRPGDKIAVITNS